MRWGVHRYSQTGARSVKYCDKRQGQVERPAQVGQGTTFGVFAVEIARDALNNASTGRKIQRTSKEGECC